MILKRLVSSHGPGCNAPEQVCSCTEDDQFRQEGRQYWATGMLAFIAGGIGAGIGWHYSMAALSDAAHAFADGLADMWGVFVMQKIRKSPTEQARLRRAGTKVVAVLLTLAAVMVIFEAHERYTEGGYMVSPLWIIIAGLATGMLDLGRVSILVLAQTQRPNEMRGGLIIHAISDFIRSFAIMCMGVIMLAEEHFHLARIFGLDADFTLRFTDIMISVGIALYMFLLAKLLWQGKHHGHKIADMVIAMLRKIGIEVHVMHAHHH